MVEMFDKIIAIFVMYIAFKIIYSIISKLFFNGMKIEKVIKFIVEKFKNRKGEEKDGV